MNKKNKLLYPKARLPRGFKDIYANQVHSMNTMIKKISKIYELYGFDPLETPAIEFIECLGNFLPNSESFNKEIFTFEDNDKQLLALRYDLTSPTSRFVAENYNNLIKPFRRYQVGNVWRNEKSNPWRFRQFIQSDADTIGTIEMAADAELAMMWADILEKLGISRGDYIIRINNRKIIDGILDKINMLGNDTKSTNTRLIIMRAIDKIDRLGIKGVRLLLGNGRKDKSGDFTKGANLNKTSINKIITFINSKKINNIKTLKTLNELILGSNIGETGISELQEIYNLISSMGYDEDRICFDPSIVRGLSYYSGPVMEAELTFKIKDKNGCLIKFGSIGGGGRYDNLISRFKKIEIPATGISIGISRLYAALELLNKHEVSNTTAPIIILVMNKTERNSYQQIVMELRKEGIRSEVYMGSGSIKSQLKYADKRGAPLVIIQGENERIKNNIIIKDLVLGMKISKNITNNKEWRKNKTTQFCIKSNKLIKTIKKILNEPHHKKLKINNH